MNTLKILLMLQLLFKIQNRFKSRNYLLTYLYSLNRGGSRTTATSKMGCFEAVGFYQVIRFYCFKIVFRYIPRKPFTSRNPSKLRSLCQIKRSLHIAFSHGVNYYFNMIFRLVIYPDFRRFCGFVVQNKFSESMETFKS